MLTAALSIVDKTGTNQKQMTIKSRMDFKGAVE